MLTYLSQKDPLYVCDRPPVPDYGYDRTLSQESCIYISTPLMGTPSSHRGPEVAFSCLIYYY